MSTADPKESREYVSVGRLARESGIKPGTLRMWERRYGRPQPERLPSGHRRYSMSEVRYVRRIVEAMALGHRPGELLRASEDELARMLEAERIPERHDRVVQRWLGLLRRFDGDALGAELREAIQQQGLAAALDECIAPFLTAVGSAWADGHIGVRHEHYATELMEALLAEFRMRPRASNGTGASRPRLLLATLPNETHGLGLSMTGAVAEAACWETMVLGLDTPVEETVAAATENRVQAVALSVSLANGGARADSAIRELRRSLSAEVALLVGGQGVRHRRRNRGGTIYLHDQRAFSQWLRQHGAAGPASARRTS